MKNTSIVTFVVALATLACAQDPQTVLDAAQKAMGTSDITSLHVNANGTLADTGAAAGGNAPHPIVKSYEADIDFTTPAMRLLIHRTNPDGTPLLYGSMQLQFVSGMYAWDRFDTEDAAPPARGDGPGAGPPPGAGGSPSGGGGAPPGAGGRRQGAAGGPPPGGGMREPGRGVPFSREASAVAVRRMQILLTPPGFMHAALQNDATATTGVDKVVSFTVPAGQTYTGTLDAMNLLTKIATTHPVNNAPIEVRFAEYKAFGSIRFPTRITHTENGRHVLDLTVTDVKPTLAAAVVVPATVQQGATQAPRGDGN